MIVLGIDPGSVRCGFGVVARERGRLRVVESGVLAPGRLPMADRLAGILDGLERVIARARPDEVSLEQVYAGASPRSALVLGQARGVALVAAARARLTVFEYAPAAWLRDQVAAGLAARGATARDAGILSTPGLAHVARTGPFDAGVMISASHNPFQDNGLKAFGHDGTKLADAVEMRFEARMLDTGMDDPGARSGAVPKIPAFGTTTLPSSNGPYRPRGASKGSGSCSTAPTAPPAGSPPRSSAITAPRWS